MRRVPGTLVQFQPQSNFRIGPEFLAQPIKPPERQVLLNILGINQFLQILHLNIEAIIPNGGTHGIEMDVGATPPACPRKERKERRKKKKVKGVGLSEKKKKNSNIFFTLGGQSRQPEEAILQ